MSKCGFTLIELMIVIAIIAILASILVPNFLKAKAQSQLQSCMAGIKNLAMAVEMCKTDEGDYPSAYSGHCKTHIVPEYMKTWPKCPSSGADVGYTRMDSSTGTKDEYTINCSGKNHKAVGLTISNRPLYWNAYGWYLYE